MGRSWLRLVLLAGVLALLATACSVEETMPFPHCLEGGSALIVAQSVPNADFVPCLNRLPAGWSKTSVQIDQDGTTIGFDSDRAGEGAAHLHFADTCAIGEDAVLVPSDKEDSSRFDRLERLQPGFREQRYYVFLGGCVWWEFDFDDGASASLAIELGDQLELFSREQLNQNVRDSFVDEDL